MYTISQHQLVIIQEAAKSAPWSVGNLILAVCNEVAAQPLQPPPEPDSESA